MKTTILEDLGPIVVHGFTVFVLAEYVFEASDQLLYTVSPYLFSPSTFFRSLEVGSDTPDPHCHFRLCGSGTPLESSPQSLPTLVSLELRSAREAFLMISKLF